MRSALRAHAARKAGELRDHPGPETLAAYHEGRLSREEADRLRDHLALCSECAEFLLDLRAFSESEPGTATGDAADGEVQAAWQAMRSRLGGAEEETPPAAAEVPSNVVRLAQPKPGAPPRPGARPVQIWAMAASWLLVAGLGVWVGVLQRENARLRAPSAEVVTVDLHAVEPTRGTHETMDRQSISAAHPGVLHLDAPGLPAHPTYEAEIATEGASGRTVWRGRASRDPNENDFTVTLPTGCLRPGLYQIRLFGEGGGEAVRLAEFPLEVRAP